jgi:DNA-binding GntR family transcriptional regulator
VPPQPLNRQTTVGALAAALRERILEGALAPGERLVERELVEAYEVSRGTVRAALAQLEHDGLVAVETHRGAFVRQLDAGGLRDLFDMRMALELESAHRALERGGGRLPRDVSAAVERLAAACAPRRPRWARVAEAHNAVHESIVIAGDSPRIASAYRQLSRELALFLVALRPVWTFEEMADQHRRLVRELEAEGPQALRRHLEAGEAAVAAVLPKR